MSEANAPEEPSVAEATSPAEAAREERVKAAAARALAEAEARRKHAVQLDLPKEEGGRDGPEPVRFGDWEKKGIATDF